MALLLVLALAVLVGAVVQRVSGMGLGMLIVPVFVLALGPASGVFVTNAVTVVAALILLVGVWRHVDWGRWGLLSAGAMVGVVPGALAVTTVPAAWLQIGIGVVVLASLGVTAWLHTPPRSPDRAGALVAGGFAGLLNVTTSAAAAATVVYARSIRWEHVRFAATMQPTFCVTGALSVVAKTASGVPLDLGQLGWWFVPVCIVAVAAGGHLGTLAAGRIPVAHARTAALVLASAGAVATVVRGVTML